MIRRDFVILFVALAIVLPMASPARAGFGYRVDTQAAHDFIFGG